MGARAVGWYKREVLEWIRNRPTAKRASGSTESNETKAFAVTDNSSTGSKPTTEQRNGNTTASTIRKAAGARRAPELPMTRQRGSGAAMNEQEELQLLRNENAQLKQMVGELLLKNNILLSEVEHKRAIT